MSYDDSEIVAAVDLLALVASADDDRPDLMIGRVHAIRVPLDHEFNHAYYLDDNGWTEGRGTVDQSYWVAATAAPRDIELVARYYAKSIAERGKLGGIEGCLPWVDLSDLYPEVNR